jgi:hypothetical protein
MVLRRAERQDRLAVDQGEEAHLFALEKFLDDDGLAGAAEAPREHRVERRPRFVGRGGDDHALARGEAIGLDHRGKAELLERSLRRQPVGCAGIARRRDSGARAEVLGEAFRAFELGG